MLDHSLSDSFPASTSESTSSSSGSSTCCPLCGGDHLGHDHDNEQHGYPVYNSSGGSGTSGSDSGFTDLATNTFKLHSNPGSNYTIYLDFDGHVTQNTSWNENNAAVINSNPYSLDSDTSTNFSTAELVEIQRIWQRVAEDFAPFNVNVTTEDPGEEALKNTGGGDTQWGVRMVMTQDDAERVFNSGGIAQLNSFNGDKDTPAFGFNKGKDAAANTASHEVGHTLGLNHDGTLPNTTANEYYDGHAAGGNTWNSLMGGPAGNVGQWSKGQYFNASNPGQDDLAQIETFIPYRTDDYGSTNATAQALTIESDNSFKAYGIVEKNTDVDVFSFITGAGTVSFSVKSATRFYLNGNANSPEDIHGEGANLDILAKLYDSAGTLVAEQNPTDSLEVTFSNLNLAAGKYYLHIEGTGLGDPQTPTPTGYTHYGSLGQYLVEGSIIPPAANLISIEPSDAAKAEGDSGTTAFTFTVTRAGDTTGTTDVNWQIAGTGTNAAAASDFAGGVFPSGTVNFAAGETSKTITVNVNGDTAVEQNEDFLVQLSNISSPGFEFGAAAAFGTIQADDASISGTLWDDTDKDGVRDAGEPGLAGQTVFLDANGNGVFDGGEASATTDASGNYTFADVDAGTYSVVQQLSANRQPTSPNELNQLENYKLDDGSADGFTANFGSFGDVAVFNRFSTQSGAETLTFLSFVGDAKAVYLYQDSNSNGRPDGNEKLLDVNTSGLGGDNFKTVSITPTTVTGDFFVGALFEGTGNSTTSVPADYTSSDGRSLRSLASAGAFDPSNPDASGVNGLDWMLRAHAGSAPQKVVLNAGEQVTGIDFGSFEVGLGSISGEWWDDANGNGVKDSGESGQAGVQIYIDANDNGVFDSGETSTTTAADGSYIFTDVAAGDYTIAYMPVASRTPTFPRALAGGETYQNDDGESNGFGGNYGTTGDVVLFSAFQPKSGQETINFLSFQTTNGPDKVFVYEDLDGDGIFFEGGEKRVEISTAGASNIGNFGTVAISPLTVSKTFHLGLLYEGNGQDVTRFSSDSDSGNGRGITTPNFDPNASFTTFGATNTMPMVRAHSGAIPQKVRVNSGENVQNVNFADECFLEGTCVKTAEGDRPVESLKIGDTVITFEGQPVQIKWIGKQTRHRSQAHPFRSLPICIKAGALGNGLPYRDLHVSPDHALLVEGLLINAGALENGTSIVRTYPEQYTYYHIELEHHAMLCAEGAPAESYLPQNQARDTFDNGDEYEELYPEHNILSLLPMNYPRVSSKRQLPRFVAKYLQKVAAALPDVLTTVA